MCDACSIQDDPELIQLRRLIFESKAANDVANVADLPDDHPICVNADEASAALFAYGESIFARPPQTVADLVKRGLLYGTLE
jgi:hypothetical protein